MPEGCRGLTFAEFFWGPPAVHQHFVGVIASSCALLDWRLGAAEYEVLTLAKTENGDTPTLMLEEGGSLQLCIPIPLTGHHPVSGQSTPSLYSKAPLASPILPALMKFPG